MSEFAHLYIIDTKLDTVITHNLLLTNLFSATCYSCHYGTHNLTSDPFFRNVFIPKTGIWTPKCETPDPSLQSTIECPYDCGSFSLTFEAPLTNDLNGGYKYFTISRQASC